VACGYRDTVPAAVAVFREAIRGRFYRERLRVSIKTEPPDCVAVPFTKPDGTFVADSFGCMLVGSKEEIQTSILAPYAIQP
jgi:hypothetical protein